MELVIKELQSKLGTVREKCENLTDLLQRQTILAQQLETAIQKLGGLLPSNVASTPAPKLRAVKTENEGSQRHVGTPQDPDAVTLPGIPPSEM